MTVVPLPLMKKPLTLARVARELRAQGYDVNRDRVANMLKWYLAEKGLRRDDVIIEMGPHSGPHSYVYNLPPDFVEWARQQFEKDKERWRTPPWAKEVGA